MTVLEALIRLRAEGPDNIYLGICSNLYEQMTHSQYWEICQPFLISCFNNWPDRSGGSEEYPIADYDKHYDAGTLWIGEQLRLRISLINYLIECWNKEHEQ